MEQEKVEEEDEEGDEEDEEEGSVVVLVALVGMRWRRLVSRTARKRITMNAEGHSSTPSSNRPRSSSEANSKTLIILT